MAFKCNCAAVYSSIIIVIPVYVVIATLTGLCFKMFLALFKISLLEREKTVSRRPEKSQFSLAAV